MDMRDYFVNIPLAWIPMVVIGMFVVITIGVAYKIFMEEYIKIWVRKKQGLPVAGTRTNDIAFMSMSQCQTLRDACCLARDHEVELMKAMILKLFMASQNIPQDVKDTIDSVYKGLRL